MEPIILIPAYNPGPEMLTTLEELRGADYHRFVVINDGSRRPESAPIFEELAKAEDVDLLVHSVNQGKGRGMKTGFNHILNRYPEASGVIVCDADGQHSLQAIQDVAAAKEKYPDSMILGSRNFKEGKNVPLPNLVGNMITCVVFRLVTGIDFGDTQCGLRGYTPAVMRLLLTTPGERFEFENTMLLAVRTRQIPIVQVGMEAIYETKENYTTHFNKVRDSIRIYKAIFSFATLPLMGLLVNLLIYLGLGGILGQIPMFITTLPVSLLVGTLAAELISGTEIASRAGMIAKAVLMTLLHAALYLLFAFLGLSGAAWLLGGVVTAFVSYPLWRRMAYGKRAENVRLDR